MRISATSLLVLALLSACAQAPEPAELRVVDPSGVASRDATFDFGSVPRGSTKALTLLVRNDGAAPLTLSGFELIQGTAVSALPGVESDAPVFSVALDGDLVLPPGGQRGFPPATLDASGDDGRHVDAAAALHGITEEICTMDWPHVSERIGRVAFGQRDHFFLTSRPDVASTPQVSIDGVALPAAASSYDPVSNAVQVGVNYLPTPGQTVTVQYQAACLP